MSLTSTVKPECIKCGKCCWDWKTPDVKNRCEYLADDFKTCLIYDKRAELRPECIITPYPTAITSLPDECPFKIYYQLKQLGL